MQHLDVMKISTIGLILSPAASSIVLLIEDVRLWRNYRGGVCGITRVVNGLRKLFVGVVLVATGQVKEFRDDRKLAAAVVVVFTEISFRRHWVQP